AVLAYAYLILIRASARRDATSARAPGRSSIVRRSAASSLHRILAAASARLALAGALTTRRILPRPAGSPAPRATMLTPALPRASQTFARTPGLDTAETVSWVVFATGRTSFRAERPETWSSQYQETNTNTRPAKPAPSGLVRG